MTDRLYDTTTISRRKVLAGLGTIGVAAAGAGLGTSAYFSDQEVFEGNSIVAGSLDMKVDWEEHYSDWSDDETAYARMPGEEDEPDYVLPALTSGGAMIPDARNIELVFAGTTDAEKQASKNSLWDATSIEALPDGNDGYDGIQDEFDDSLVCEEDILVDVGGESAGLASPKRTRSGSDGINGQVTEAGDPLINIMDAKPGDFGEVTFSFHLCDNPGYVWLNGQLVEARENGHTEPEMNDPDEFGSPDEVSTSLDNDVEILDGIVTRMWYDPNGNNQVDTVAGELDIMLALDASGSINGTVDTDGSEAANLVAGVNAFVDALPDDGSVQVGQVVFGENSNISRFSGLGNVGNYSIDYPNDPEGNTPLPPALDIADQELDANGRQSAEQVVVVFTDGAPNYQNTTYTGGTYTAPRANDWSADDADLAYDGAGTGEAESEQEETALVAEKVRDGTTRIVAVNVGDPADRTPNGATDADGDAYPKDLDDFLREDVATSGFYFQSDLATLEAVADDLVALVGVSDKVFFQGTLREALVALSENDGRGVPLDGDTTSAYDELSDPENDPDRDCFAGEGTTHYVGFQWWLPIDHANQIQSDSVSFDLGFYTEQCRHNDGAGMNPEEMETTTQAQT